MKSQYADFDSKLQLFCHSNQVGFHLHFLVFNFINRFNSRIEALVCSSFANDLGAEFVVPLSKEIRMILRLFLVTLQIFIGTKL